MFLSVESVSDFGHSVKNHSVMKSLFLRKAEMEVREGKEARVSLERTHLELNATIEKQKRTISVYHYKTVGAMQLNQKYEAGSQPRNLVG